MDFPRKDAPTLDSSKELQFQITDWYIPENDRNRKKPETPEEAEFYNMIIYGTTNNGITVSMRVTGYEPYFYVKPPESWEKYSDKKFSSEMQSLVRVIEEDKYQCVFKRDGKSTQYWKKIVPNGYDEHLRSVTMVKKKDFWGFTNNTDFRFIKVTVRSLMMFNTMRYYFDSRKTEGFKMYESNIDPFLRYIHEQNIKPCGWVSVTQYKEEENDDYSTRCDYNIMTDHNSVTPIVVNNIAPLLVASFDIECMSSHGDFPVAKKDYRKVAQDLAIVAKAGYNFDADFISYCLETIYKADAKIDNDIKIHKVYPKNAVDFSLLRPKIVAEADKMIEILDEISNISVDDNDDNDDDDEVAAAPKSMTVKQQNILESKLNAILTKILPPLKGDEIIQIGTTVHKYGSEEIVYKNIISLNTCDAIKDADVISCKSEKQLLLEWRNLMGRLNPDILSGYNIFGFDMEYMWIRAVENQIADDFLKGLGRNLTRKSDLIVQKLSSSALGDNELKYFDLDGIVVIDLLKVMQRDHKLDSYKLDNVAQVFIGDKKDDLKPHEIFKKFKGTSSDRCTIANYCIQDCALVNRILHKLKIMENNIGMANVCLVPLNYLFKRGQGIKIFSLVAKQCMDRNHLIPVNKYADIRLESDMDGYEGAVVLEPKEGIYLDDPIVVFDYGSLYPSSMIARNLSHDCYVMDKKYQVKDDPNIDYTTVSYDLYEGTGDKKKKVGVKECVFAQYKDGRKGIISDILCMLLTERKNTRKKMEYKTVTRNNKSAVNGIVSEKGSSYEIFNIENGNTTTIPKKDVASVKDTYNNFEKDVFDALQLAYKITANSLYGQIGARTSPIYLKDIAACTTATGREMIMLAKDFVEKNYNAEVIYGDSVMPYTPITYRTSDQLYVNTFEKLEGQWTAYEKFKQSDANICNKEQFQPIDMEVWTHRGWSKIVRVIRHKTVKKIYRVYTESGCVDVTEDHSLLDITGNIIKPFDCMIGTTLLHSRPQYCAYDNKIDINQAYLYGFFMGNGKTSVYTDGYIKRYSWEIVSESYDKIQKCLTHLESVEKHIKFHIIKCDQIYKIKPIDDIESGSSGSSGSGSSDDNDEINGEIGVIGESDGSSYDIKSFVEKYQTCYHSNGIKIVPHEILNCDTEIIHKFKEGLDDSSGILMHCHNQITAQSYVVMCQRINETTDFYMRMNKMKTQGDMMINDIHVLHEKYDGYVYDIETEDGVFHGGVGNMILKNTDSIFCKFPLKNEKGEKMQGKESLKYAIEIGKHVEKNIVSIMPNPQKLNYEKSMYPFILFSKKRYVGNLYEMDTTKFKQKSMGIVLKRRDNAQIVKKIFGGIIDILLNQQDMYESIKFLKEELQNLVDGKTPIDDLVISKSLRGVYKDATKIPHKVLADRIGERDPGNKPQVNDRVPFVYIKVPDAKLQGDRIENPEYIVQNNLVPDYLHYITNQIMNPVLQLYALCLEELPNYDKPDDYWDKMDIELQKKPIYQDDVKRKNRMDNLKLKMVQELLFQEYIDMLSEPKIKKPRKNAKLANAAKIETEDELAANPATIKEKKPRAKKTDKKAVTTTEAAKTAKAAKAAKVVTEVTEAVEVPPAKDKKPRAKKSDEAAAVAAVDTNDAEILQADIKVTKKKDATFIEGVGKITNGKKVVWKYTNTEAKDKIKEIIAIIVEMTEYAKEKNKKLIIKTNLKQFQTEYAKSLMSYIELEEQTKKDTNMVQNVINSNDTGAYKNVNDVFKYEQILKIRQFFEIQK